MAEVYVDATNHHKSFGGRVRPWICDVCVNSPTTLEADSFQFGTAGVIRDLRVYFRSWNVKNKQHTGDNTVYCICISAMAEFT